MDKNKRQKENENENEETKQLLEIQRSPALCWNIQSFLFSFDQNEIIFSLNSTIHSQTHIAVSKQAIAQVSQLLSFSRARSFAC